MNMASNDIDSKGMLFDQAWIVAGAGAAAAVWSFARGPVRARNRPGGRRGFGRTGEADKGLQARYRSDLLRHLRCRAPKPPPAKKVPAIPKR